MALFEQKNLYALYRQSTIDNLINIEIEPELYIAYLQTNWRPTPLWDIETGVRYNFYVSDTTYRNLAPRFSAKYKLTETTNLKFATGIYHQYLHRVAMAFVSSYGPHLISIKENQHQLILLVDFKKN